MAGAPYFDIKESKNFPYKETFENHKLYLNLFFRSAANVSFVSDPWNRVTYKSLQLFKIHRHDATMDQSRYESNFLLIFWQTFQKSAAEYFEKSFKKVSFKY